MKYAICPYCNKNILIDNESSQDNICSGCGETLGSKILELSDSFIDMMSSNEEYTQGKLYFDNSDFLEAGNHFKKALYYNRNNYLANYYFILCEVYENEKNDQFDIPKNLAYMLKSSVEKMENSGVELKYKIGFLCSALNEAYIMLLSFFNNATTLDPKKIITMLETKITKRKLFSFLDAINSIDSINKEHLLFFEEAIASSLIGINDLGIAACFKAAHAGIIENNEIVAPTDDEFDKVKMYFLNFNAFISTINQNHENSLNKVDYSDCIKFNKDVLLLIDNYYSINKDNNKNFLSITGELLNNLLIECTTAVKLTYFTCIRNLTTNKNDSIRLSLINQAIIISCEVLRPRLYIDANRHVNAIANRVIKLKEHSVYLNSFFEALPDNMKKTPSEYLFALYNETYEMIKLYYSIVNKNYGKILNKIKRTESDELKYYRNFLFQMACGCCIALSEVIKYYNHKMKPRVNLLKICLDICNEFFLTCDYKIELIEASQKYCDLLNIFSTLETDITYLTRFK